MTPRHLRRAALVLVPALAFLALLAVAVARRAEPPRAGDPAPDFTAPLLAGGGSFSLSEARGKPVLLNFWASWCAPCRDEAPLLRRAHRAFGGDVTFVGVDVRDARGDALRFAREHGVDYTLVRDDGSVLDRYGVTGQPETFFIDADGRIVEHVTGPLFAADLQALLDVLVARDG